MLCQSLNVKVAVLNEVLFFSACGQEHGFCCRNVVPSFARDECLDTAVWSLCCSLVLFGGRPGMLAVCRFMVGTASLSKGRGSRPEFKHVLIDLFLRNLKPCCSNLR